jgi:hypothetical protein
MLSLYMILTKFYLLHIIWTVSLKSISHPLLSLQEISPPKFCNNSDIIKTSHLLKNPFYFELFSEADIKEPHPMPNPETWKTTPYQLFIIVYFKYIGSYFQKHKVILLTRIINGWPQWEQMLNNNACSLGSHLGFQSYITQNFLGI